MERLKLKGRIIEKYGSVRRFADHYGTTPQTVNKVIRGDFTPTGISLAGWLSVLDIPKDQAIFFFGESLEN